MRTPSPDEARAFVQDAGFHWHQRFELAPGVESPGRHPVYFLLSKTDIPQDLSGMSVLDIGTTNGAMAFEMERRGAAKVVAVDIVTSEFYGFSALRDFLGSSAEFLRASVYELPEVLDERFDLVLFWGVLYHLRHPLLALDRLRSIVRKWAYLETQVSEHQLADPDQPLLRFNRGDELAADATNWFLPTIRATTDMCASAGFRAELSAAWPEGTPERCMVKLTPTSGRAEYVSIVERLWHTPARPVTARFVDW